MESFRSLFPFESTPVEFTIRVRVMLSRTFFACSCFFALRVCSGMRTVFLQLVPESSILVRQVSAGSSSALEAFHFDGWSRTSIHYSYASGCQEKFLKRKKVLICSSKIPLWFETSPFRGKNGVDKTAKPMKSFSVTPPSREGQSARPLSVGCGVSRRMGRLWIETSGSLPHTSA